MIAAIWIVTTCVTASFGPALVSGTPDDRRSEPVFEIRLAETAPAKGLKEVKIEGTEEKVYIRDKAIVTETDVAGAFETQDANFDPALGLEFTERGEKEMTAATEMHQGKPVVILLDGKAIVSLKVNVTIKDRAILTGLNEAQMKRLGKVLKPRP